MEPIGKARGGKAAAEKMTPEERKLRSAKGNLAKKERAALPTATHIGELKIGNITLPCAVLPDGTRVISQGGISTAFGPVTGGYQSRKKGGEDDSGDLPPFLTALSLKPFIDKELRTLVTEPLKYNDPRGGPVRLGLNAGLLPKVCEIWLRARDANALTKIQIPVSERADILMRGLAHVGIISLVDEATGFQRDRERDSLAKILEAFVAKELQPYVRTFPPEYYEHLFRLYGLQYPPVGNKSWRPSFFGHVTNEVVYNRLAPNLLPELKKAANKAERKSKLHSWLTQDIGHPKLKEHLASLISVMKLSKSAKDFLANVNIVHPRYGKTLPLDLDDPTQH